MAAAAANNNNNNNNNNNKREGKESGYDSSSSTDEGGGGEESWWMRRREASDDGDGSVSEEERVAGSGNQREKFGSDDDGVGGAPEEEEEDDDDESSYLEEFEEAVTEAEEDEGHIWNDEKEPVIPRIGAFYMHDDRFGCRTPSSGKKLQQVTDERKWQHDKFEEVQRISYWYNQGNYGNQDRGYDAKANWFKFNNKYNNRSYSSRIIKGRGPVKYRPLTNSSYGVLDILNKEYRQLHGSNSNIESAMSLSHASKVGSDSLDSKSKKMHRGVSSSNPDIAVAKRRDLQPSKTKGHLPSDNVWLPHSDAPLQGQHISDYMGRNKLNAKKSIHRALEHHHVNPPSRYSLTRYTSEIPQSRGPAINVPLPELMSHLSLTSSNRVDNFSPMGHHHAVQQTSLDNTVYCPLQTYNPQFSLYSGIGPQPSFIPPLPSGYGHGVWESFASFRKSERAGAGRGSAIAQGYGRGSQCGESYGRQNLVTSIPPLPSMQFRDQHPVESLGKPAIHTRAARYISEPKVGFGNSNFTRPSFLPDNVGCLAPNITPSGGYNAFSSGQDSIGVPSHRASASILGKPPNGNEVVNDQYRHRRIKLQRYSKMNFKQ